MRGLYATSVLRVPGTAPAVAQHGNVAVGAAAYTRGRGRPLGRSGLSNAVISTTILNSLCSLLLLSSTVMYLWTATMAQTEVVCQAAGLCEGGSGNRTNSPPNWSSGRPPGLRPQLPQRPGPFRRDRSHPPGPRGPAAQTRPLRHLPVTAAGHQALKYSIAASTANSILAPMKVFSGAIYFY